MLNPTLSAPDIYRRYMTEHFDEKEYFSYSTVFLSLFGGPGSYTHYIEDEEFFEYDIILGDEKLAPSIKRGAYAEVDEAHPFHVVEKFSTVVQDFPLLEMNTPLNASQLLARAPGEHAYQRQVKQQRLRKLARRAHGEHIARMIRSMEYLAMCSVTTGKQPVYIGSASPAYDWKRASGNILPVATVWSDAAADIMGHLDGACLQARKAGRMSPDFALVGSNAMAGILKNTAIKALADNRKIDQVSVVWGGSPPAKFAKLVASGAQYRGRLMTPSGYALELFSYVDMYQAANGTHTPYLNSNLVVLGNTAARNDRAFGPTDRLPVTPSEAARYAETFGFSMASKPIPERVKNSSLVVSPDMFRTDAWYPGDNKAVNLRTQCAPLFITTHTNSWVVLHTNSTSL